MHGHQLLVDVFTGIQTRRTGQSFQVSFVFDGAHAGQVAWQGFVRQKPGHELHIFCHGEVGIESAHVQKELSSDGKAKAGADGNRMAEKIFATFVVDRPGPGSGVAVSQDADAGPVETEVPANVLLDVLLQ